MNQELNIILNISRLIQSSFGINGKFKLISYIIDYNDNGDEIENINNNNSNSSNNNKTVLSTQKLILTNDGLKILKSFNNSSIYYNILLQQSNLIYEQYGSGVSQFIILVGNLLKESIKLIKKGFQVNEILNEWRECRIYLKKYQFMTNVSVEPSELKSSLESSTLESSELNSQDKIQINYNIKENFINNHLESIVKVNLSKNLLNNHIKKVTDIIKSLLIKLPTLDQDKIKILLIINDNQQQQQLKEEEEDNSQDNQVNFELFDGILFESTFSFAGKDKLVKYIDQPRILLFNNEIELKHQKEYSKIEINNNGSCDDQGLSNIGELYLKYIESEKELLLNQLNNIYSNKINLILNQRIIGDLAIQEFVKKSYQHHNNNNQNNYKIQCNGLIKDQQLFQDIVNSTGGIVQSSLLNLSKDSKFYGTCKRYRQINIGKKSFELLEGLNDSTQTIILKGSSKQTLNQFKQGLLSLLKSIRSIIINDDYNVVGSIGNFELNIIKLLNLKINSSNNINSGDSNNNIKKMVLIKSLIKSISNIIKLLLVNSNLDLELFDQFLEFGDSSSIIDIENSKIDSVSNLNYFESNSMKFSILNSSIELLSIFLKSS